MPEHERRDEPHGVGVGKLLGALSLVVFGIDLAETFGDGRSLVVFAILLTLLAVSAHIWGRDSRDGADWKPRRRRSQTVATEPSPYPAARAG